MLKKFYCRLSTATLLTLMLILYYHLEEINHNSNTKNKNVLVEDNISLLLVNTEKAIKLLEHHFFCNQSQASTLIK